MKESYPTKRLFSKVDLFYWLEPGNLDFNLYSKLKAITDRQTVA